MPNIRRRPSTEARTKRTLSAFQNYSYRLLWPASFFTYIARWMQITLLSWLVLELSDSPFQVALVGFFSMAPLLLLGVVGGVLADRLDRRRLLLSTQALNLAAAVIMVLVLASGLAQVWHAYLIILVGGVGWALDTPSRRSLVHDLLGRSGVTNAIALDSVGMNASRMLGPALAGALITVVDVVGGYVVVSLFYLVPMILVWRLRLPRSDSVQAASATSVESGDAELGRPARRSANAMIRNLGEGLRYVRGNSTLMAVVMVTIVMNLLHFPYMQMIPVIARDVLGVGPGLMGLLVASDGMGGLIGSMLIASAGNISYHGRVYMVGSILGPVMALMFSLSHWYALSVPVLLLMGLGTAGFGTMQATIVLLAAREEMRGRALGVVSLAIGAGPLGSVLIGAVASTVTPAFAIALNSILGMVLLALTWVRMPSLWRPTQVDRG